jgi:hypothetical protein
MAEQKAFRNDFYKKIVLNGKKALRCGVFRPSLHSNMPATVRFFLGRFALIAQRPVVVVAHDWCDGDQHALLAAWTRRGQEEDGVDAVPESVTVHPGALDWSDVAELDEIVLDGLEGAKKESGFVIGLQHLRLPGQLLVRQLAEESLHKPWVDGFFHIKIDHEGAMQGWSRAPMDAVNAMLCRDRVQRLAA